MYDTKTYSADHRIVSITQPWLRPIERGKAKAAVEFGTKPGLSIDSEDYSRLERVLADQIYRTRENRNFCRDYRIRLSRAKLGRSGQNAKADKKQEYEDNTDRLEVERAFSLDKRCYGMGLITKKLEKNQQTLNN